MGQVIDFETRIDRPCDTEPPCEGIDMADRMLKSAQAVEGYKAQHTEQTSSHPFPYANFYQMADGRCQLLVDIEHDKRLCIPITRRQALRYIEVLAGFAANGRHGGSHS